MQKSSLISLIGAVLVTVSPSCKTDDEPEIAPVEMVGSHRSASKSQQSKFHKVGRGESPAFYQSYPHGQRSGKRLEEGTRMRVLDSGGTYARVELSSGQTGYVRQKSLTPVFSHELKDSGEIGQSGTENSSRAAPDGDAPVSDGASSGETVTEELEDDDPLSESIKRLYRIHKLEE